MFIRQTEEEYKEALVLIGNSAIDSIRTAEGAFGGLPLEEFGEETEIETEIKFKASGVKRGEGFVIFVVDFRFIARQESDVPKGKDLLRVQCRLEARYNLRPEFNPTEGQIKAFHRGNVIFNCWPYFREFVQSSTSRMHIPPPPIPFLRILPPGKAGEEQKKLQAD